MRDLCLRGLYRMLGRCSLPSPPSCTEALSSAGRAACDISTPHCTTCSGPELGVEVVGEERAAQRGAEALEIQQYLTNKPDSRVLPRRLCSSPSPPVQPSSSFGDADPTLGNSWFSRPRWKDPILPAKLSTCLGLPPPTGTEGT